MEPTAPNDIPHAAMVVSQPAHHTIRTRVP